MNKLFMNCTEDEKSMLDFLLSYWLRYELREVAWTPEKVFHELEDRFLDLYEFDKETMMPIIESSIAYAKDVEDTDDTYGDGSFATVYQMVMSDGSIEYNLPLRFYEVTYRPEFPDVYSIVTWNGSTRETYEQPPSDVELFMKPLISANELKILRTFMNNIGQIR